MNPDIWPEEYEINEEETEKEEESLCENCDPVEFPLCKKCLGA